MPPAVSAGYNDALVFNEHDELTGGAIHNIFIVKDGVWKTPAIRCGLLPGTCREQFLREHPEAREEVFTLDDLTLVDQIYFCNSERGVESVELDNRAQGQRTFVVERSLERRCL